MKPAESLTPGAARLGAPERAAALELARWLDARFSARVRDVRLFGSRARGCAHEASDVDLLVVIDDLTAAERREIAQMSGDGMTNWSVLLSPFAVSTQQMAELRASERRIAREIDRDGIPL